MTLRELVWMAEGRGEATWNHTAMLCATLCNINRDTRKHPKPFSPELFTPYGEREKKQGATWDELEAYFKERNKRKK